MTYPDDPSLTALITWLLGGGLGVAAYWCRYWLDQHTRFHSYRQDHKLAIGAGIALLLGAGGGALLTLYAEYLGIAPAPTTGQDWHYLIYSVAYKALIAARLTDIRDAYPSQRVQLAQRRADQRAILRKYSQAERKHYC